MARVVHLSTVHHDWDNRIINKECRALAQAGIDTHLVISAPEDRLTHGVHVHAIRKRGRLGRLLGSQREAWLKLAELKPDLLHIHDPELIPLAIWWGRLHRRPVIYDAHEDLVKQLQTKPWVRGRKGQVVRGVARWLLLLADQGCDAIVAATTPIAGTFRRHRIGRGDRPVVVVQNLPWAGDFPDADVVNNGRVAVYTGDLSEERGFTTMVDATSRVPGASLLLAGRALGTVGTDERLTASEVVDYRGLVQPSQLAEIIGQARVGLVCLKRLPNYENSLPTKVFEYMASGVPFLATDFPAWKELFGGYDAGVFVNTDDPAAVASALSELINDPGRCAELGANGRRAVQERFGFENEAAKLVNLVRTLTA